MRKINKSLLAIITLCSMNTKIQTMKTCKITYEKPSDVVKLWTPKPCCKTIAQEKRYIRKFFMYPSRLSTLLALFAEYDKPNYGYLTPKHADLWEVKNLFTPKNIKFNSINQWVIKFRATPPFCDIEPIQQKINC